jgi:AhpD family alkylhydroperoxidase
MTTEADTIHSDQTCELIREGYGSIAAAAGGCASAKPSCCGSAPAAAAELPRHIAVLTAKPQYVAAMTDAEDPVYQEIAAKLPAGAKIADYLVSLEVQARKPAPAAVESPARPADGGIFRPEVGELVAIGAAVAANCEPCRKYHYDQATRQGGSTADIAQADNLELRLFQKLI